MDAKSLASSYDRVWAAFEASGATEDGRHDTADWQAHAGPYAVCVIRIDARSLEPELDALRQALDAVSGVRIHPDPFLHVTLQELGFVVDNPESPDELSPARLEEFAQAAIEPIASTEPFPVTIGGANAFSDAVFLEVHGGGRVGRLHTRLFDLAAIPAVPKFPYLPHATVAHFLGGSPARDAAAAIAPWRNQVFGEFTVAEVEIVTLDSNEPYPPLESYAAIPLGG